MTVRIWLVQCDRCHKIIDAIEEAFITVGDEDVCTACFEEKEDA